MEQISLDELNEELVPVTEPERQEYYMNLLKNYIDQCKKEGKTLTYCVQTFGCQMNAHDSERLEGILEKIGFVQAPTEDADVVLYNTCTVRENANKKLFGHLGHLKNKQQKNMIHKSPVS